MGAADLFHRLWHDLAPAAGWYQPTIKALTIALLCYIALIDLRRFKIANGSVLLLLALYILYAVAARSWHELLASLIVGVAVFGLLLLFYRRGAIGGGDVKLLPVACLWIANRCVLLFAVLLLVLVGLHLVAVKLGWARGKTMQQRAAIAYAPSIAGALIGSILAGCV
jgi:prepilin peptidase CpaA